MQMETIRVRAEFANKLREFAEKHFGGYIGGAVESGLRELELLFQDDRLASVEVVMMQVRRKRGSRPRKPRFSDKPMFRVVNSATRKVIENPPGLPLDGGGNKLRGPMLAIARRWNDAILSGKPPPQATDATKHPDPYNDGTPTA